jgi:hypothetical protein
MWHLAARTSSWTWAPRTLAQFHGYKRRVYVYLKKKNIINPWMNWWPLHNNWVYDPTADYTHCIAMVFTSSNIFCIRFGDGLGWLHRIASKVSSELQRRLSLLRTLLESPYNLEVNKEWMDHWRIKTKRLLVPFKSCSISMRHEGWCLLLQPNWACAMRQD